MEAMVRRRGIRAEGLAASPAAIDDASPFRSVETVADQRSGSGFSRQRAAPVGAVETLHRP